MWVHKRPERCSITIGSFPPLTCSARISKRGLATAPTHNTAAHHRHHPVFSDLGSSAILALFKKVQGVSAAEKGKQGCSYQQKLNPEFIIVTRPPSSCIAREIVACKQIVIVAPPQQPRSQFTIPIPRYLPFSLRIHRPPRSYLFSPENAS